MTKQLILRPAEMADADLLLLWRNDVETRQASHNTDEVVLSSHLIWLEASLSKPDQRRLWVAEMMGKAVGTCRADRVENRWELSWTVAPEARGKGVAHQMLSVLVSYLDGPLVAQVRSDNMASIKVVERAGFAFDKEESGVLYYVFFRQSSSLV
ncbi:GNAT family N-acetyltransferase [Marinomonas sp. M1K-6]|uniref:GNAT family N-acetyltransferase n=1 Tax=Marinomonas profundi TaxID=2726122 RepID=A0A847R933_9GAMM|nr:GNAT family N-acetyltransferase [Marinomonas profundi]NLQ17687.1 GNAT family N-acetyltransferase [Marinomonas profundi]UDV04246.1 GNAT family N-acetyltransferase [Marinomonas profundi]